jgi:hypothetical protein
MEPFITNITRLLLPPTQNNSPEKREGEMSPVQSISHTLRSIPPTALADDILNSLMNLAEGMREEGMNEEDVVGHVRDELERGFARGQSGPRYVSLIYTDSYALIMVDRYFGFVTGGALPAAQVCMLLPDPLSVWLIDCLVGSVVISWPLVMTKTFKFIYRYVFH